jgi:inner membrane protein
MPTSLTHGLVAAAAGKAFFAGKMPTRFWVLAVVCSALPDVDTVGLRLGVPYGHFLGHRGFLHSLAFALILSVVVVSLAFRRARPFSKRWLGLWLFFFAVSASHGLLDAMTNGGLGIALFAPFDNARYFLPFRPLEVSPIGIRHFFSRWGLAVLRSEILWVWLPAALLLTGVRVCRGAASARRRPRAAGEQGRRGD